MNTWSVVGGEKEVFFIAFLPSPFILHVGQVQHERRRGAGLVVVVVLRHQRRRAGRHRAEVGREVGRAAAASDAAVAVDARLPPPPPAPAQGIKHAPAAPCSLIWRRRKQHHSGGGRRRLVVVVVQASTHRVEQSQPQTGSLGPPLLFLRGEGGAAVSAVGREVQAEGDEWRIWPGGQAQDDAVAASHAQLQDGRLSFGVELVERREVLQGRAVTELVLVLLYSM